MEMLDAVEKMLGDAAGWNPESTGRTVMERAVASMVAKTGIRDPQRLSEWLKDNPERLDQLIEEVVVVPETWLFRDGESFAMLRDHVRRIRDENRREGRVLRVLSAPCSTGEEAYSIAITLMDAGIPDEAFEVWGVDISEKSILAAERGRFGKRSFRGPKREWAKRWFTEISEGYQADPRLVKKVNFHTGNLTRADFAAVAGQFHVVFCKNLVIYLSESAKEALLKNLDRLLKPGGILFTGHSELMFFCRSGYVSCGQPRTFACVRRAAEAPKVNLGAAREGVAPPSRHVVYGKSLAPIKPEAGGERWVSGGDQPPPAASVALSVAGSVLKPGYGSLGEARMLADRGDLAEALTRADRHVSAHPSDAEGHFLKGLIRLSMGDVKEAEAALGRAVYLDPGHYDALVNLSLIYERAGSRDRAAVARERAARVYASRGGAGRTPPDRDAGGDRR